MSLWTEHTAPTGHKYYYNSETKQSTYTKPVEFAPAAATPIDVVQHFPAQQVPHAQVHATYIPGAQIEPQYNLPTVQSYSSQRYHTSLRPRDRRLDSSTDRPKSRHALPDSPWFLVKTKLGRRFVWNPETNESFWKFPKEVIGHVVEFDIQERKQKEQKELTAAQTTARVSLIPQVEAQENQLDDEALLEAEEGRTFVPTAKPVADGNAEHDYDSDEYEEVEVTDDEDAEGDHGEEAEAGSDGEAGNGEFGEDDMAYQLAQMGETYQLDPGEYGQQGDGDYGDDWEEGAEGLQLTEEEINASFKQLLDDFNIDPFTTWEKVIEDGFIIEDNRYTLLSNMKARRSLFTDWSASKTEQLKEQRASERKANPVIPYLTFIQKNATPKLFWPEFRRKYKKEPEMTNIRLSDKDREKLYREHINRITKIAEPDLKADLRNLLRSIPASSVWNRATSLDHGLPPQLVADVRFISLRPSIRDAIILDHLQTLPDATRAMAENEGERAQQQAAQARRDAALQERRDQVEREKKRQRRALETGKEELAATESELRRATRVGKEGLSSALGPDDVPEVENVESV